MTKRTDHLRASGQMLPAEPHPTEQAAEVLRPSIADELERLREHAVLLEREYGHPTTCDPIKTTLLLAIIDLAERGLARLTAEQADERDPDEIIGDAIARANPAKWEDVPSRVSPDREVLARHIDRLRDDLKRVSATRELTGFEITASTIADALDDLIRAPAPDREALARRLDEVGSDLRHKGRLAHAGTVYDAIAALRLPAQAEVEEITESLKHAIQLLDLKAAGSSVYAAINKALNILPSLPSPVGEWRPTRMIVCAAIRFKGGIHSVSRPGRHGEVIRVMHDAGFGPECMHDQGFLTSDGLFVDRVTALTIAEDAGQIVKKTGNPTMLFSEDVW